MQYLSRRRELLVFFLVLLFAGSGASQVPERLVIPAEKDPNALVPVEAKLESKLMARAMPYRVLLPKNYEANKTKRFPVVYLLHGLTGSYRNWTDLTRLTLFARDFDFIIVTPEGNNGWYTDSQGVATDQYESYIIKELIPEIDRNYRTLNKRESRAIAGLSMGGYGAIKFGMKYPELFKIAGSFSGALGAAQMSEASRGGNIGKSIDIIFGQIGSEARASNDVFRRVREITPEQVKSLPFLYVDCGTEDFLFKNNVDFAALLVEKKIPHEFRQLPGAHNWTFWNSQALEFLRLAQRGLAIE